MRKPESDSRIAVNAPLLAVLALLGACGFDTGSNGGAASSVQRTDSAGVPVVVNPADPPPGSPVWTLSPEPTIEIGVVDGPPEYTLHQAFDGARLSDGTIVVANAGTAELRFYDATGTHIRSVGGEGDAPGEFRSLRLAGVFRGDSLVAFDIRQRRASVYGPRGGLARTLDVPDELEGTVQAAGVLSDGSLVLARWPLVERETGVKRQPVLIDVLPPGDPTSRVSLGAFPGDEYSDVSLDAGGGMRLGVPFGRDVSHVAAGKAVAIGTDDAFSIRVYDEAGGLVHIVRQDREPAPLDPADLDLALERTRSREFPPEASRIREMAIEQMPKHTTLPSFSGLWIDRPGNLWVREMPPGVARRTWQVFDPEGALVTRIELPAGLEVLDIGEDYLLATFSDELGVDYVRLYRLEKGGAG